MRAASDGKRTAPNLDRGLGTITNFRSIDFAESLRAFRLLCRRNAPATNHSMRLPAGMHAPVFGPVKPRPSSLTPSGT